MVRVFNWWVSHAFSLSLYYVSMPIIIFSAYLNMHYVVITENH